MKIQCCRQCVVIFRRGTPEDRILSGRLGRELNESIDRLLLEKVVVKRELKEFIRQIATRFSDARVKKKLRKSMNDHFVTGDPLALRISMSIYCIDFPGDQSVHQEENTIFKKV
jgi:hypothetical protein